MRPSKPKVEPVQPWGSTCSGARDMCGTLAPSSKKTSHSFSYRFRGNLGIRGLYLAIRAANMAQEANGHDPWSMASLRYIREQKRLEMLKINPKRTFAEEFEGTTLMECFRGGTGGELFYFIFAVLWTLLACSKMSFYLKTCTPVKGTP